MPEVFTAITTAISLSRQLLELANAAKDAQTRLLIAELTLQLAEVKLRLAELLDENIQLKVEIDRAKKSHADVVVKNGLYYSHTDDGPYCTGCFDNEKKLIRLAEVSEDFRAFGNFKCPICKTDFGATEMPGIEAHVG